MAIDQGSFRAVNAPSAAHAVKEFIKRLTLNDYLGLISYPQPGVVIDPTRERGTVNEAVSRISDSPPSRLVSSFSSPCRTRSMRRRAIATRSSVWSTAIASQATSSAPIRSRWK